MRWQIEHGDPDCRYCRSPDSDCPVHVGAPQASPMALFYMRLYSRVKRWQALPNGGGVLDQDEWVMRRLDLVAGIIDEHERKEAKLAEMRRKNAETLAQLRR